MAENSVLDTVSAVENLRSKESAGVRGKGAMRWNFDYHQKKLGN